MSFRVNWLPSAEEALLQIVISRPDRGAVVDALDRLGTTLQQEGPAAGESREGEFRVLFALPLAAKFVVDQSEQLVTVVEVWAIGGPQ
jgi:hypothetical protein